MPELIPSLESACQIKFNDSKFYGTKIYVKQRYFLVKFDNIIFILYYQMLPEIKLKAEIKNLEIQIINQYSQQMRLEDKYAMLQKSYDMCTKALETSHNEVMDAEEIEYILTTIENKKNVFFDKNYLFKIKINKM